MATLGSDHIIISLITVVIQGFPIEFRLAAYFF